MVSFAKNIILASPESPVFNDCGYLSSNSLIQKTLLSEAQWCRPLERLNQETHKFKAYLIHRAVQNQTGHLVRLSQNKKIWYGGREHLPSMFEALSLKTTKTLKKKKSCCLVFYTEYD